MSFCSVRFLRHLPLNCRNRVLECFCDIHQLSLDFAQVLRRVSGRSPSLCLLLALLFCLLLALLFQLFLITVPDRRCYPCGPGSRAASFLLFTTDFFRCGAVSVPLLQSHSVVVCDSVHRASSTSLGKVPLRDCCFAVDALASRIRSLQQCFLLSVILVDCPRCTSGFHLHCAILWAVSSTKAFIAASCCVVHRVVWHRWLVVDPRVSLV